MRPKGLRPEDPASSNVRGSLASTMPDTVGSHRCSDHMHTVDTRSPECPHVLLTLSTRTSPQPFRNAHVARVDLRLGTSWKEMALCS